MRMFFTKAFGVFDVMYLRREITTELTESISPSKRKSSEVFPFRSP